MSTMPLTAALPGIVASARATTAFDRLAVDEVVDRVLPGRRKQLLGETCHRGLELLPGQSVQVVGDLRVEQLLGQGLCGRAASGHGRTVRVSLSR